MGTEDVSRSGPLVPIDHQMASVERELGYRRRLYPKWVANGKITQKEADHELACMKAVLDTLQEVWANRRLI